MDSLKIVLKNAKQDTTRAQVYLVLGEEINLQQPDSALELFNKAKKISENNLEKLTTNLLQRKVFKHLLAESLNNIGSFYDFKGFINKSLEFYVRSLKILEELGEKSEVSTLLNNIGLVYKNQGHISKALDYYGKSLRIREEIKNKNGIAISLNNIALIYKDQGDISKALDYLERSLKINEETVNKRGIASSLSNIAVIYRSHGDPSVALNYYVRSLKIQEEIGDKRGIATSLNNIGIIYEKQRDTSVEFSLEDSLKDCIAKALEYHGRSLRIREEIADKQGVAMSLNNIGYIYLKQKNYQKAIEFSARSMKISEELGYPENIKRAALLLNKIYKKQGNYNDALINYEIYIQMRDSINNIETQKTSIKQQSKYEFDKQQALAQAEFNKQQAITHLELQNKAVLIDKNKQLLLVLKKDNELKELHLLQNSTELKQKQILSENQQKQIQLLDKEKKISEIDADKKDAELKKQRLLNYSLAAGVLLVSLILFFAIRGYQQKKKANEIIHQQKKEVENKSHLLEDKNHIIEEKQKEILDSIHYAKRLQEAILPPLHFINEHVPNNFVLYQPKDVVAGDFYWSEIKDDKFFIAAADSTGHGVPGAMVSVVCSNALNRTVNEFGITDTGKILDKTRELVLETFAKGNSEVKDGMDISLLCIDKSNNKVYWSGANNPLWYVKSSVTSSAVEKSTDTGLDSARPDIQLIEIKADKQPIGKSEITKPFTAHEIALQDGMQFYLFTDGFADQFGGPRGKKFMYKQLESLLLSISNKAMQEQKELLEESFLQWKGDLEQVDDVCVIGVRV